MYVSQVYRFHYPYVACLTSLSCLLSVCCGLVVVRRESRSHVVWLLSNGLKRPNRIGQI